MKQAVKKESTRGMWKRTFSIFKGVSIPWHLYLLDMLLGIAGTKLGLLYIPYETKLKMGNIDEPQVIWFYILLLILSAVISLVTHVVSMYSSAIVSRNLQKKMIRHSVRLPIRRVEETSGKIISWITQDSNYAHGLITTLTGFITGGAAAVMSMQTLGKIQPAFMAFIPFILVYVIFCTWLEGKLLFLRQRRGKRATSELTAFIAEHLSAYTQIKQLHTEKEEAVRGRKAINVYYKADLYQALLTFINNCFSGSITSVLTILVFLVGMPMVRSEMITLEALTIFQSVILVAYNSLSSVPQLYTGIMYYNGELFYLASHLDAKEEQIRRKRPMDLPDSDIILENVSFSYTEDTPVLKNINARIEAGKCTMIVGQNGSGKSTLFKLLDRFYTPTDGQILFGDVPAEDLHLDEWRQCFAYILQEPQLFNGTIRDNITFGMHREVSDAEVELAAKMACCDEFIREIPEGYDFIIGDNGSRLSGGQRQRIAIARAVLTDPAYLLMDEATSNVDVKNEQAVTEALHRLMKGRTTVMISHDMHALNYADNVIVLKDGCVEAAGTKESVLAESETLRRMVASEQAAT